MLGLFNAQVMVFSSSSFFLDGSHFSVSWHHSKKTTYLYEKRTTHVNKLGQSGAKLWLS
jgi:hypothetical protein